MPPREPADLSLDLDHDDKRCQKINEDGSQCKGFHTRDSSLCNIHKTGADVFAAQRQEKAEQRRILEEKLQEHHYPTKTVGECQQVAEDILNGILKGVIKRDKAAPLGVFLGLAYSMAKTMHSQGGTTNRLAINIQNNATQITMNDAQMDEFLRGNDSVKITLLENLQKSGKVTVNQKADGVTDVEAQQVEPSDVKIDADGLASLTNGTSLPLTKAQVKSLFGTTMGDKSRPKAVDMVDPSGFDEVFERKKSSLPQEARSAPHLYKGKFEVVEGSPTAALWFTCQFCGDRQAEIIKNNKKYSKCPMAPGKQTYED